MHTQALSLAATWKMIVEGTLPAKDVDHCDALPDTMYFRYVGDDEFMNSLTKDELVYFLLLVIEAEGK